MVHGVGVYRASYRYPELYKALPSMKMPKPSKVQEHPKNSDIVSKQPLISKDLEPKASKAQTHRLQSYTTTVSPEDSNAP